MTTDTSAESVAAPLWRRPWVLKFYAAVAALVLLAMVIRKHHLAEERRRAAAVPPPVSADRSGTPLAFGHASIVAGTGIMRVDLIRPGSPYVYDSYAEVRNILFLDPGATKGRWLLPDAEHVIAEQVAIEKASAPNAKHVIAVVAVVKPFGQDLRAVEGRLIVFDPTGVVVEPLSEGVRDVHIATVDEGSGLRIMYERRRKFVLALIDRQTLKLRNEQVFEIPSLGN